MTDNNNTIKRSERPERDRSTQEHPTRIGAYRILDVLGEGGMAVVYLAEQSEPVRRRVALKIVKLGMDSKEIVARFESERQALAVLDHPNIAKIFDGGITESGRPYFVMERVQGIPITDYCDIHRLDTSDRVELFAAVCSAVQHAHHKGLIHRDLKPSNLLVGVVDGKPQVKIIDFGIAKATSTNFTEKTLFTKIGQIMGTPQYMSPEQADITGLDVDSRTDIYSLGVVLYEMLVGVVPLDLTAVGMQAIRVAVRERDAPKPSTRITELGDTREEIARVRNTDPENLRRQLKGDLDWVVMRAIAKDRTRRYETANELAMECWRFLKHEPVLARPPRAGYVLRRFIRRNRVMVVAGSIALLAVLAGAIAAIVFGLAANRNAELAEQARAEGEEVVGFLLDIFYMSDPSESLGNTITAKEILDRGSERIAEELSGQPRRKALMLGTIGGVYQSLGLFDLAEAHMQEAYDLQIRELGQEHKDTLASLDALTLLALDQARYEKMEAFATESLRIHSELYGDEDHRAISALSDIATARSSMGDSETAVLHSRQVLDLARKSPDVDDTQLEVYVRRLAIYLSEVGEEDEAGALHRESLQLSREVYGEIHPNVAFALDNLAIYYDGIDDFERAEPLYRQALAMLREIYGDEHPEVAQTMGNVAGFLIYAKGEATEDSSADLEDARNLLTQALASNRKFRPDHPHIGDNLSSLAELEKLAGRYPDAEELLQQALEIYSVNLQADHPMVVDAKITLGEVLLLSNDLDGAEQYLLESEAALTNAASDLDSRTEVWKHLLKLYQLLGRQEKIEEYEQKLL